MSRQLRTNRRARSSLRTIGIPDARDALAIYLRWVRQARYYRAHAQMRAHMSPELRSSVAASDGQEYAALPPTNLVRCQFDVASLAYDLTCVGAGLAGAAAVGEFPHELADE